LTALRAVPVDGGFKPFVEGGFCLEAEEDFRASGVEAASWLTVGLGGVTADLACKAGEFYDFFGEVPDFYLEAGADIDGVWAIVEFGSQQDTFCGIGGVNELA